MPLGTYRLAAVGAQLGIGVAGTMHLSLGAVGKGNSPQAAYCLANELICGELGRFLRLPVPPGGIVTSPHQPPLYASLDFNLAGVALPPVNPTDCLALLPKICTGVLLFDILIANSDRHPGNLSLFLGNPPLLNVFDHSHALFGHEAGKGVLRLSALAGHLAVTGGEWTGGNRHCLLQELEDDQYFGLWLSRIQDIPDFYIDEICHDAQPFGLTLQESIAVRNFLKTRRDSFPSLIQSHREAFPAVRRWSLL